MPPDELTEAERLCLCDYAYTRGQVWQPGGECPPGYDPSHPRQDEAAVSYRHGRMDCDTGMWGGR